DAARAAGFGMRPVGIEAWVDLPGFDLRGKRFADLRQMRNRAAQRGVTIEEARGDAWQGRVVETWQSFLAGRRVPWQVRWLSGGPPAEGSRVRRTFVAHRDGVVQAFCTLLPGSAASVAFDVMCRHPAALPGSMEGLLVAVLQRLRDEGVETASLGPCPLAGGAAAAFGGPLGWALRWAWGAELGDRWFGFRRLAAFKNKFRPRSEVVHLGLAPRFSGVALYRMARIWALEE
ncbi:MAG: phosphatidylglycerol lysyltransferase domain-containing protein, partial [Myxococcota bacterium]